MRVRIDNRCTTTASLNKPRNTGRRRPELLAFLLATVIAGAGHTAHGGGLGGFDGQGCSDLAIGVPGDKWWLDNPGEWRSLGGVNVLYGDAPYGLSIDGQQLIDPRQAGQWHDGKSFGKVLAAGDFNGDKYLDLAVGAPGDSIVEVGVGMVSVFYGSASGLPMTAGINLYQAYTGMCGPDPCQLFPDERFGESLAAGDFNGDGITDLAIGVPQDGLSASVRLGAVHVVYGSSQGLDPQSTQFFGGLGIDHRLGHALAAGDFNCDGMTDLAIGEPGAGSTEFGELHILPGSPQGLLFSQWVVLAQISLGYQTEDYDWFASTLAAGDFDGNHCDDLAIGVPYEDLEPGTANCGVVHVLYGSASGSWIGLDASNQDYFYQGLSGIIGAPEPGDRFGSTLAVGDFNGDLRDDLMIGVPHEDFNSLALEDGGVVHVLYGSNDGLDLGSTEYWVQGEDGLDDTPEENDWFGAAGTAGDFNCDGYDDLVIGVPGESFGTVNQEHGAIHVLHGSPTGLDPSAGTFQAQYYLWISGDAHGEEWFGASLAALPRAWHVFDDGFETGTTNRWSIVSE